MIASLLACGFIPGCIAAGGWLLRRFTTSPGSSALERLVLAGVLGMILALPLLVGTAVGGWYSPWLIGTLGWVVTGVKLRPFLADLPGLRFLDLGLLTLALAVGGWHTTYRTESIFAGRDQGVYSNHALHLAETGQLRIDPIYRDLFTDADGALAAALQAGGYFFDFAAQNIYLQFAPTFALYLAQGYGMAGDLGLFAVNPWLAALNTVLFFGLARRWLPPLWTLAATALFTFNLAQVWIARITLSETLTQTWFLAGLLLLQIALAHPHRATWLLGALLVASCTLIRVDAFLLVIALAATGAYLAQQPQQQLPDPTWRRWGGVTALAVTALGAASFGYGLATSPGYYADFAHRIVLMLVIAAGLTGMAWVPWSERIRVRVLSWVGRPGVLRLLLGGLVVLALYAYFVRPHHEPFANFAASIGWEGRDYRENSLRDLGAYLSPVALALALGGLGVMLHRTLIKGSLAPVPFLAAWLAVTLLYLYNPYISSDHIWKIRRYVPVVIPGGVLLSMIGLASLTARISPSGLRAMVTGAGLLTIFSYVGWSVRPIAFTQLNAGAVDFIRTIEQHVPADALIVADVNPPLLGPLQLGLGREVVRALPGDTQHERIVKGAVDRATSAHRPVVLLSRNPQVNDGENTSQRFTLSHPTLVQTLSPPPRTVQPRQRTVYLAVLGTSGLGYDADAHTLRLGAHQIFGVTENGFLQQEFAGPLPFRWTGGSASLRAPWIFAEPPFEAALHILSAAPAGSPVTVRFNETIVFDQTVPAGGGVFDLPIAEVDWTRSDLEIELTASTFVPAVVEPGSTDDRELGIQLGGLVVGLKPPWAIGRWEFGWGIQARETATGLYSPETLGDSPARWTDGQALFRLRLPERHPPARLIIPVVSGPRDGTVVTVRWNGVALAETTLVHYPDQLEFDLNHVPARAVAELEIVSPPFRPTDENPAATDQRKLGVMLGRMALEW